MRTPLFTLLLCLACITSAAQPPGLPVSPDSPALTAPAPDFYVICDGGKFGYIDATGNVVIQPVYEAAFDFSEGLALVRYQGRFGFFNTRFQWEIAPELPDALPFSEAVAPARVDWSSTPTQERPQDMGFIDRTGRLVISPVCYNTAGFKEGLAAAELAWGRYGYLDPDGKLAIPASFENALSFSEGLAAVQNPTDHLWGYIDTTGAWVTRPIFERAESFNSGRALVRHEGVFVFIDRTGNVPIQLPLEAALSFNEGFAPVRVQGRWGLIDVHGQFAVPPIYDRAGPFAAGSAPFFAQGRWGYVAPGGKTVCMAPEGIRLAYPFRGELAAIETDDGGRGYINRAGVVVYAPTR